MIPTTTAKLLIANHLLQAGFIKSSADYIEILNFGKFRQNMTEQEWAYVHNISESDALAYPNARTAYELQQSPLAKALA